MNQSGKIQVMRDGHTHSQFCPHANIPSTALLVEKAISLGFAEYSITEHPPLPPRMRSKHPDYFSDYSMDEGTVDDYITHVSELKKTYADRIQIKLGFELEFFPVDNGYTVDFVAEYRDRIEDCLISLHFLPVGNDLKMLDFSPEDVQKNLLPHYSSLNAIHDAYWHTMMELINTDFNGLKPRIGHLGLINKFIKALPITKDKSNQIFKFLEEKIFPALAKNSRTLDFNTRGFSQKFYQRAYLDSFMIELCKKFKIPVVYGSDAHSEEDVGKYYGFFESQGQNLFTNA